MIHEAPAVSASRVTETEVVLVGSTIRALLCGAWARSAETSRRGMMTAAFAISAGFVTGRPGRKVGAS